MLRLALIENLRRVGSRLAAHRIDRNLAGVWADQMTEIAGKDPKSLILVVADMARSNPPIVSAFVAEFARRLQGQGAALVLPLTWIEQRLAENGLTIERLVQSENQQQAADQVSISNSIGSLRFLGAMDWREFVEDMSVVEKTLRQDPGGIYGKMDFATRDRYRHLVEKTAKIARRRRARWRAWRCSLPPITRRATAATIERPTSASTLIDKGLPQLQQRVGARSSASEAFKKLGSRFPLCLYLGAILLVTAILAGGLAAKASARGIDGPLLALVGALSILCASHLAVSLVNWLVTLLARPHKLPRMDFSEGIPPECRTLVVVPTLLTDASCVERLIEALEVRFLANQGENIHFGLLTDFPDAHEETTPEDAPLLGPGPERNRRAERKVSRLGRRQLFSLSSPAPMESSGADLDGLRTQARKALGFERAAARARGRSLFADRREHRRSIEREVRHYARHRYAAASRCRLAMCRRHGAPSESRAI